MPCTTGNAPKRLTIFSRVMLLAISFLPADLRSPADVFRVALRDWQGNVRIGVVGVIDRCDKLQRTARIISGHRRLFALFQTLVKSGHLPIEPAANWRQVAE